MMKMQRAKEELTDKWATLQLREMWKGSLEREKHQKAAQSDGLAECKS